MYYVVSTSSSFSVSGFCCVDGEVVALWSRMEEKVREKFALKEVFCVESTVRVAAMRNVGR